MRLDLHDLSLRVGERHEREYCMEMAPVVLGGVSYEVLIPGGVLVAVNRVAGGFLVNVSMSARVYGQCSRCLREVAIEVVADQREFVPTAKDGWEESELSAFVKDMVVDVDGIAREALILALPVNVVCSSSCKGLCAQCGHDLNQGACNCVPEDGDDRWQKLRSLRFDD